RAARARRRARRDARDPGRVRQEAQAPARRATRPRLHGRSAAGRHLLRVGVGVTLAVTSRRRHVVLPRRARAQGDLRARRVLRRRSGQAPGRPRVAVPQAPAVLVRPDDEQDRARARAVPRARRVGLVKREPFYYDEWGASDTSWLDEPLQTRTSLHVT